MRVEALLKISASERPGRSLCGRPLASSIFSSSARSSTAIQLVGLPVRDAEEMPSLECVGRQTRHEKALSLAIHRLDNTRLRFYSSIAIKEQKGGDEMATLVRFDPFRELASLQNEMSRMMGGVFTGSPASAARAAGSRLWMSGRPSDEIVYAFDLPGIPEEKISVELEDGTLSVSAEREREQTSSQDGFHRYERHFGTFERTISLPVGVPKPTSRRATRRRARAARAQARATQAAPHPGRQADERDRGQGAQEGLASGCDGCRAGGGPGRLPLASAWRRLLPARLQARKAPAASRLAGAGARPRSGAAPATRARAEARPPRGA